MDKNNNTIFKNGPKCKKCGGVMYATMETLPLLGFNEPLPCWKCSCGNATFTNEQLENMQKVKKAEKQMVLN